MWDYSGEPLPDGLVADIDRVSRELPGRLEPLIGPDELDGVSRRAAAVVASPEFPAPQPERRPYPWPLV
jgi:hypothetical protein